MSWNREEMKQLRKRQKKVDKLRHKKQHDRFGRFPLGATNLNKFFCSSFLGAHQNCAHGKSHSSGIGESVSNKNSRRVPVGKSFNFFQKKKTKTMFTNYGRTTQDSSPKMEERPPAKSNLLPSPHRQKTTELHCAK